jgi:hypothetical protein
MVPCAKAIAPFSFCALAGVGEFTLVISRSFLQAVKLKVTPNIPTKILLFFIAKNLIVKV